MQFKKLMKERFLNRIGVNKDIELSARDGTFLGGIPSEKGFGLKKVDKIRSATLVLRAALLIRCLTKK